MKDEVDHVDDAQHDLRNVPQQRKEPEPRRPGELREACMCQQQPVPSACFTGASTDFVNVVKCTKFRYHCPRPSYTSKVKRRLAVRLPGKQAANRRRGHAWDRKIPYHLQLHSHNYV